PPRRSETYSDPTALTRGDSGSLSDLLRTGEGGGDYNGIGQTPGLPSTPPPMDTASNSDPRLERLAAQLGIANATAGLIRTGAGMLRGSQVQPSPLMQRSGSALPSTPTARRSLTLAELMGR